MRSAAAESNFNFDIVRRPPHGLIGVSSEVATKIEQLAQATDLPSALRIVADLAAKPALARFNAEAGAWQPCASDNWDLRRGGCIVWFAEEVGFRSGRNTAAGIRFPAALERELAKKLMASGVVVRHEGKSYVFSRVTEDVSGFPSKYEGVRIQLAEPL
jgi:hypothetical protein